MVLEFKKMKRSKLIIVLILIVVLNIGIHYLMGNVKYVGIPYAAEPGWTLQNTLIVGTYYLLLPVFTLIGSASFIIERENSVYINILTIPVRKSHLILNKSKFIWVVSMIFTSSIFVFTLVLEKIHSNILTQEIVLKYLFQYVVHSNGLYVIAMLILSVIIYMDYNMQLAVMVGFVSSFVSVFIEQTAISYLYPVNALFNISGFKESNLYEYSSSVVILCVIAICAVFIYKKIAQQESW